MKNICFVLLACFLAWGCTDTENAAVAAPAGSNLEGYILTPIPGGQYQIAELRDADGKLVEMGRVDNDQVKNGTWIVYHPDNDIPKTVSDMVDGVYNGVHQTYSNRGQLELAAAYVNNQLHGKFAKFKFGRKTEEGEYLNGQPHGRWITYYANKDIMQQETNFKNGKQHGALRYFNEEGEVTMEYDYKDGEKISGGIVEKN